MKNRNNPWICLALIAANLFVYSQVTRFEFVNFDDPEYVIDNPYIQMGVSWPGLQWSLSADYAGNWFPLTWLSLMLDYDLHGLDAGGYHLTNLLLHLANSLLLFFLLLRMSGDFGPSSFVAMMFAIHPQHVESVAWISERKDVLSTLFWMFTVWAYFAYTRRPRPGSYALILLCFGLGLMAKPMLVTLPVLLLLLDVWPLRRWSPLPGQNGESLRALVWEKLPLLALSAASSLITIVVQHRGGAVAPMAALPILSRIGNALISYLAYIGKMFWPTDLSPFYPWPQGHPAWMAAGALAILSTITILVVRARRHPYLLTGWLWYLCMLMPVIGIIQVGQQARADRYTYLPLVGLFIMIAWGIPAWLSGWRYRRPALTVAALLATVLCAVSARSQASFWANSSTLWRHALRANAANDFAHNNLGNALADAGEFSEAMEHYREALRIKPRFAEAHASLGNALAASGQLAEAGVHYAEALAINANYAQAHNNFGAALARQGQVDEAIRHYRQALQLQPDYSDAQYNLGAALSATGMNREAVTHYREALRGNPRNGRQNWNVRSNLAAALAALGESDQAIAEYHVLLRIRPDFAEAHNNLGTVLAGVGRRGEAMSHYRQALRLKADYAEAHNNLANALVREARFTEAIGHYQAALRGLPDNAAIQNNLRLAEVAESASRPH